MVFLKAAGLAGSSPLNGFSSHQKHLYNTKEHDPGATMTSRFGKTYSRKRGGETSKFDEVLSSKRGTLSTKWGATTYKARVGSKRAGDEPVPEVHKRPRPAGDDDEDPFGFDSDEESKPVSSRFGSKSAASAEPPQAARPGSSPDQGSRFTCAPPGSPETSNRYTSDGDGFQSSPENGPSFSWYQNAAESDRKPLAQTTALKTSPAPDAWDLIMGLRSASTTQEPTLSLASAGSGACDPEERTSPSPPSSRKTPPHSRTHRRPNKDSKPDPDTTFRHPIPDQPLDHFTTETEPLGEGAASTAQLEWTCKTTDTQKNSSRETRWKDRDFFSSEDDAPSGTDGPNSAHSANKVEYFGFDDMSDNEDDEDNNDSLANRWSASKETPSVIGDETPTIDIPDPFNRPEYRERAPDKPKLEKKKAVQESRTNTNTQAYADLLGFLEDDVTVVAEGPRRPPQRKAADKNPDSHRRIFSAQKKSPTKAVYNARHWAMENEEEPPSSVPPSHAPSVSLVPGASRKEPPVPKKADDDVFKAPPPPPKVTKCLKVPTNPCKDTVTALKCHKEHKELYTVVQHVKHFNDVVEFGENQEFTDDFEYLATGLKTGQPLNTRCLSVIGLATRCAMPGFRMHLRARGKVAQVFRTLCDAPQYPNLALCTASLMYILSRDRLKMDLDRSCLELMIRLLEMDQAGAAASGAQFSAREVAKIREKIRKICDSVHNKHLDLQNITTSHLAMETLLSLTSKRAGDWYKEELRLLGGLDHIVDKVVESAANLNQEEDDEEQLASTVGGAQRCLRVLESVTAHKPENQVYLIAYKDSALIVAAASLLTRCVEMIQRYGVQDNAEPTETGLAVDRCMRAVIGILLNLTHDNEWGSTKTGEQDRLLLTVMKCVLKVPQFLPQGLRFDMRVLGLGLLTNLVENSARNRYGLMELELEDCEGPCDSTVLQPAPTTNSGGGSLNAIIALVQLFLQREQAALISEARTDTLIEEAPKVSLDQSGEWQETGGEIQWVANNDAVDNEKKEEEDKEMTLSKVLQQAGKNMEDSIVASYTALLLGCLCQGSPLNVTTVRENLPKGDFSIMTTMLRKFFNFMSLTCDTGSTAHKSMSRVIDYLEHL